MGEASCQSFINESVSKVGSKPTSEMTQYHLNLIFAIIVKRKKSGKKISGHDYGIIGDTFRWLLNIIKEGIKSGTTKNLTIPFARNLDVFPPRSSKV